MASSRTSSSREVISNLDQNENEESPLLSPAATGEDDTDKLLPRMEPLSDEAPFLGEEHEVKSSWYMFLLTLGALGLQMGWAVEMSNGSPYLLSLGLNKALLALVWIAGPLSGVLVQPYVGLKSDRSRSKYGKRRPYVVGGAIATMFSLMILAWAREIVTIFLGIFGAGPDSEAVRITIMIFAVIFIYVLDFAINVLQAALRAYAVDCTPHHQQETANAWVSRLMGIGNIFGMLCSGVTLRNYFPFLGGTQFKILCALATISIAITVSISVVSVPERDASLEASHESADDSLISIFKGLWKSIFHLPPQIMRVCQVQFLAWIGWFPFLFYTSTYIAEIYADPFFEENPNLSKEEIDLIWEEGTRRGSVALFLFATVTFISSILLPFFIPPTYKVTELIEEDATPLTRHMSSSTHSTSQRTQLQQFIHKCKKTSKRVLNSLQIPFLTLRKTWLYSHFLFFILMWLTLIARSISLATILVALVGIPWAVTMWAPFSLIAAEIAKRDAIRRGIIRPPPTADGALLAANEDDSADQAGVVLGIHNVSVSAPQIIATVAGSLLFQWLQKPRGQPGDESVAWFFRLGGLCALLAAWWTLKVGDEGVKEVSRPGTSGNID